MKIEQIILILLFPIILECEDLNLQDEYIYEKVYISKIVVDDTVKAGWTFKVEISGEFPTPGWELYKIEIKESDNELTITPIARIKKGIIVPQVLVPFSKTVELTAKPEFESIKISVVGRTGIIEKIIKVTSK